MNLLCGSQRVANIKKMSWTIAHAAQASFWWPNITTQHSENCCRGHCECNYLCNLLNPRIISAAASSHI